MSKRYNHKNSCWIIASHFICQSIKHKSECIFSPMAADVVVKSRGSHVHGRCRIKRRAEVGEPHHIISSSPPPDNAHSNFSHHLLLLHVSHLHSSLSTPHNLFLICLTFEHFSPLLRGKIHHLPLHSRLLCLTSLYLPFLSLPYLTFMRTKN